MTPCKTTALRWKSHFHYHLLSYLAKIKLQYMKNTFHVAPFHMKEVLQTRNVFTEVNVIKSRGALGTGFSYAPVLLFELYLAINNSSTSHFHSTSHFSSRRKNTPTLRVTSTLRVKSDRSRLGESLFEKEEYFHSTSHLYKPSISTQEMSWNGNER